MVHLIAVLLILFPGFGAGYLLLGRFRQFTIHFLFSAFLGTFITIALIFRSPLFLAGMVFAIAPMLVWNVYHAHRLWLEVPAGHSDSKAEQVRFSYTLAPLAAAVILALGLILGIMAVPLMFSEEQPRVVRRYDVRGWRKGWTSMILCTRPASITKLPGGTTIGMTLSLGDIPWKFTSSLRGCSEKSDCRREL